MCRTCAPLQDGGASNFIQTASSGLEIVSLLTDPLQLLVWPLALGMESAKSQRDHDWARWCTAVVSVMVRGLIAVGPHARGCHAE